VDGLGVNMMAVKGRDILTLSFKAHKPGQDKEVGILLITPDQYANLMQQMSGAIQNSPVYLMAGSVGMLSALGNLMTKGDTPNGNG
jgi:hypothetical protein